MNKYTLNDCLMYIFFLCRENDITGIIDHTFAVEHESFGVLQMKELKSGGSNVVVTEDNKKEYVKLYVNHRFMQVCVTRMIFSSCNGCLLIFLYSDVSWCSRHSR